MLDLDAIRAAPVATEPFRYFVARNILSPDTLAAARADFPAISGSGVYPPEQLTFGTGFSGLMDDLRSEDFEEIVSEKLGVPLEGKPLMITVRGNCHRRDGRIHTDSRDKIVTGLLYLNEPGWQPEGGRLRLLRGPSDLDDMLAEVPPDGGTLVMFKRADNSWHGHHPFEGQRRYVMFNWLTSDLILMKNTSRHTLSARIKRLNPFA
jgi:hypothetical protein